MFGVLNIHKPTGWTSRDVVNRVQGLVRPHKAGHAGTLDPLATGVLVVCIGAATRLIEYVQAQHKRYRGTFLLGRESDTEDSTGEVRELASPTIPTRDQIEAVLPQFLGTILQRPPAYSALKVQGKRAYQLARQGQEVELAPRPIDVFSIEVVRYAYPELVLDIHCGSGTYVRSLGRDIAEALGTAAVMSALERTQIGVFSVSTAISLDSLTKANIADHLLPPRLAVVNLPSLSVNEEEILRLVQGKVLLRSVEPMQHGQEWAALNVDEQLMAIVAVDDAGVMRPTRVFAAQARN